MRAHAFFTGTEQMNRKQPFVQGNVSILKHSSDCYGELLTASGTLPQSPTCVLVFLRRATVQLVCVVNFSAMRAHRTIRPAQTLQEFTRLFFIVESSSCALDRKSTRLNSSHTVI